MIGGDVVVPCGVLRRGGQVGAGTHRPQNIILASIAARDCLLKNTWAAIKTMSVQVHHQGTLQVGSLRPRLHSGVQQLVGSVAVGRVVNSSHHVVPEVGA